MENFSLSECAGEVGAHSVACPMAVIRELHFPNALNKLANCPGVTTSGLAEGGISDASRTSDATSVDNPRTVRTTRSICFRLNPNAAWTKARKDGREATGTSGCSNGVSRTTAESTFGGGLKTAAATLITCSTSATTATFTVSAP